MWLKLCFCNSMHKHSQLRFHCLKFVPFLIQKKKKLKDKEPETAHCHIRFFGLTAGLKRFYKNLQSLYFE